MRISAKGRYAVAAMAYMARTEGESEHIAIVSIAEKLGISKIYLEQVFSLLKRGGLVHAIKGSQGGYSLSRLPSEITVFDVLSSVELSLFEEAEPTVQEKAPDVDMAMRRLVFNKLDRTIRDLLSRITLSDLVAEAQDYQDSQSPMYFI